MITFSQAEKLRKGQTASSKGEVEWVERDSDGRRKRCRIGETRIQASATGFLCLSRLFVVITHLHNLSQRLSSWKINGCVLKTVYLDITLYKYF